MIDCSSKTFFKNNYLQITHTDRQSKLLSYVNLTNILFQYSKTSNITNFVQNTLISSPFLAITNQVGDAKYFTFTYFHDFKSNIYQNKCIQLNGNLEIKYWN